MEYILNEFIKDLIKELKRENGDREYYGKVKLNIPYIIAPLKQRLLDDEYIEFLNHLSEYTYRISYNEDQSEGYTNGSINIFLYSKESEAEAWNTPEEKLSYTIEFTRDERNWGYCECEDGETDYREDKECCGHGCDWAAPEFRMNQVIHIGISSWCGNAHDYWNFEDDFYKSDKDLAEEKAKKDEDLKIKYRQDNIDKMKKELLDLLIA